MPTPFLVRYIRSHGCAADLVGTNIRAGGVVQYADGTVKVEWALLPPTWAAVRQWLGY